LKLLPQWELEAKRPFLIRGERVVDTIQDALEAKEAAKEAKKVCQLLDIYESQLICSAHDRVLGPSRRSKPLLDPGRLNHRLLGCVNGQHPRQRPFQLV
jgi:hypothetical protein